MAPGADLSTSDTPGNRFHPSWNLHSGVRETDNKTKTWSWKECHHGKREIRDSG